MSSSTEVSALAPIRAVVVVAVVIALVATTATAAPTNKADEAAALSVVAASKAKTGAYSMCADLYVQAYRLDPSYLGYLYSAARCWQKAKKIDDAERGYRAFLKRAPKEHPLQSRARTHLDEIIENRSKAPAKTGDKVDSGSASSSGTTTSSGDGGQVSKSLMPKERPMSMQAKIGWSAIVAGGLIGITGVVLSLLNESERSELKEDLKPKGDFTLIHDETLASAQSRADEINGRGIIAFSLTGAGVIAAAAGTFLLWNDDAGEKKVSLLPAGRGAMLRVRF